MFKKLFIDGLKTVVPLALILALIVWIFHAIELFFGTIVKDLIGAKYYFTGLGLIVGIVIVFIAGIFVNAWFLRNIHAYFERLMDKIPIVKTLYSATRDFLDFFSKKRKPMGGRVVMVNHNGMRFVGIVIRDDFTGLTGGLGEEGELAVYIPMSYNIGGFTINIPASCTTTIDMPVEKAMTYVITAGMTGCEATEVDGKNPPKE